MNGMSKLILAFVTLILGAVLIGTIAGNSNAVADKTIVLNEAIDLSAVHGSTGQQINESLSNFTVTNNPTTWKITDCPITVEAYGNSTTDYTLDTDYEVFGAQGAHQPNRKPWQCCGCLFSRPGRQPGGSLLADRN